MSTPEHVAMIEATVARQRAFFQTGATRPVAVRVAALHKLKREMQARETILLDALYADLHKSHAEGYMCELGLNLDELGYLARKLPQWAKPQRLRHQHQPGHGGAHRRRFSPGLGHCDPGGAGAKRRPAGAEV